MIPDYETLVEKGFDFLPVGGQFLPGNAQTEPGVNGQVAEEVAELEKQS